MPSATDADIGLPVPTRPAVYAADDLADDATPIEWVVDNMFAAGSQYFIAGPPKTAKSYVAMYLSKCVSEGLPFLGRTVRRQPVLYLALEGGKARAARRWKELGLGHGGARTDLDRAVLGTMFPDADTGTLQCYDEVLRAARDAHVLVIIDSFSRVAAARGLDENAMADATQLLAEVEQLLNLSNRSTIIWIDHFNKRNDAIRGSSAKQAVVDGWLEFFPTEDDEVVRVEGKLRDVRRRLVLGIRTVEDPEAHTLSFVQTDEAPARTPEFKNARKTVNGSFTSSADVDRVRDFLFRSEQATSTEVVARGSGIGEKRAGAALEQLQARGEADRGGQYRRWAGTEKLVRFMTQRYANVGEAP